MPEQNEKIKPPKVPKPPKLWRDVAEHVGQHGGLVPNDTNPYCLKCGLNKLGCKGPMAPVGSTAPKVTVLLEAVGPKEEANGLACDGSKNGIIRKHVERLITGHNITADEIRWLPLTRCAVYEKIKINYGTKGNWCRTFAVDDLRRHPPAVIIAVGSTALGALSHKSSAQDWSGLALNWRGWPDDWLTNQKFRQFGHPSKISAPEPANWRTLWAIQAPYIIYAQRSREVLVAWLKQLNHGLSHGMVAPKAKDYLPPHYTLLDDPQQIIQALDAIPDGTELDYDTETTGLYPFNKTARLTTVQLRCVLNGKPRVLIFPVEHGDMAQHFNLIVPRLARVLHNCWLVGHNIAFDLVYTAARLRPHVDLWKLTSRAKDDTRLMVYALHQSRQSLGLERLAYSWAKHMAGYEEEFVMLAESDWLKEKLHPEHGGDYAQAFELPEARSAYVAYTGGDVEVVGVAKEEIRGALLATDPIHIPLSDPDNLGKFRWYKAAPRRLAYEKITRRGLRTLARMTARGMHIDPDELAHQEDIFPKMIKAAREKLRDIDPRITAWCQQQEATVPEWRLDLENREQLKAILFDILQLPVKRLTESGEHALGRDADLATLPREQLMKYAAIDKYTITNMVAEMPRLEPLKDYRKLYKGYTMFVRSMRNIKVDGIDKNERSKHQYLMEDHCVHPTFNQAGTGSGRISCVSGDTVLITSAGPVAIEDLEINNEQQVLIKTHEDRWRPIIRKIYKGTDRMFRVTLANGASIKCTANHRFLSPRGWVQLGRLKVGDRLCSGGPEHTAGTSREGKEADTHAIDRARVRSIASGAENDRSATDEFRLEQKNDIKHEEILQGEVARVCTKAEAAAFGEAGEVRIWESARSAPSVGASSTRRAGVAAGERMASVRDCATLSHVGLHCGSEYTTLRNNTADDAKPDDNTSGGIRASRSGTSMPRHTGSITQRWIRQEEVYYSCAFSVYEANWYGEFLKGDVQIDVRLREVLRSSVALHLVVDEQVRDVGVTRAASGQHTVCQGDAVSQKQASRFCVCWDKSCFRGGRTIPHAETERGSRRRAKDLRVRGDTVYKHRSGKRPSCRCSEDTGTSAIVSIESISDMGVWDVEVFEDHSYHAQGFINHNSSSPNAQQIQSDSIVKRMYTSRYGKERGCIYQADLSQIELRLLAAACGDPLMVKAYREKIDLHSLTASKVFKIMYEQFEKSYMAKLQESGKEKEAKNLDKKRKISKKANFLTSYGGGPFGLQTSLAEDGVYLELSECEFIIEGLFDTYPCMRKHISYYKKFILENACAVSLFGRVRTFDEVKSDDHAAVAKALRSGFNHMIQSSASDMMILACSAVDSLMHAAGLESMLISTVHDSMVVDAVRDELPKVHEIVDSVTNNLPDVVTEMMGPEFDNSWLYTVPIEADSEAGPSYGQCYKIVADKDTRKVDWDKAFRLWDKDQAL